jgi:hypothetical protein
MNTARTYRPKRLGLRGTKFLFLAGFLAASIQPAHGSEAPTLTERPNADAGPTQVSVGIWIVDINNIDSAQQSFGADVFIALSWKDPRLAHTGTGVAHSSLDHLESPDVHRQRNQLGQSQAPGVGRG